MSKSIVKLQLHESQQTDNQTPNNQAAVISFIKMKNSSEQTCIWNQLKIEENIQTALIVRVSVFCFRSYIYKRFAALNRFL